MIRQLPQCRMGSASLLSGALVTALMAATAFGQSLPIERWVERARQARYQPIDISMLQRRRQDLADAVSRLDRWLATGGPKKSEGWKRYLHWDQLEQATRGSVERLPAEIQQVGARFYSGYEGLELPKFVAVREALTDYVALVNSRANQRVEDAFKQQIDSLVQDLQQYGRNGTAAARLQLAERLEWFESLGQIPGLIDEIRQAHRRPNIELTVSEEFVREALAQPVQETNSVRDVILGTTIYAQATTSGRTMASLVPNAHRASIAIQLEGTAHAPSIGYNGPVTIRSTSTTALTASKVLMLDLEGVVGLPSRAWCRTSTQIHSISAGNRLARGMIECIAWKRAARQKPQAEQIASQHAAVRVQNNMDQRTAELVEQSNQRLRSEVRQPLVQRGIFPREVRFATTDSHLRTVAMQAAPRQLAAASDVPAMPPDSGSLLLRVHESLVNNTAELAMGGLRLTDRRAADIVKQLTGSVPEELQLGEDQEPWSITFALRRPVTVAFNAQLVEIALEGRQFTRGDTVLNRPLRIAANYRAQVHPEGVRLTREGEVDVTFPGREGERLSVREVALKSFMHRKFSAILKPEFEGQGLELPGRLGRTGRLFLSHFAASEGWMSLGWK